MTRLLMGHAGGRLVEQDKPRPAHECPADLGAPPVDHRQACGRLIESLGKIRIEHAHQLARFLPVAFEFRRECAAPHHVESKPVAQPFVVADHDVVEHGKRQAHARTLKRASNPRPIDRLRRRRSDVFAGEVDLACFRAVEAGYDIEQGRLSRTIRSDQADDLAIAHREVHTIERDHAAEAAGKAFAGKKRRAHAELGPIPCGTYSRSGRGSSPPGRNSRIKITSSA